MTYHIKRINFETGKLVSELCVKVIIVMPLTSVPLIGKIVFRI